MFCDKNIESKQKIIRNEDIILDDFNIDINTEKGFFDIKISLINNFNYNMLDLRFVLILAPDDYTKDKTIVDHKIIRTKYEFNILLLKPGLNTITQNFKSKATGDFRIYKSYIELSKFRLKLSLMNTVTNNKYYLKVSHYN